MTICDQVELDCRLPEPVLFLILEKKTIGQKMSLVPQYLWEQDCCTRIKHLLSTNLAEQGWKLQLIESQICTNHFLVL